MDFASILILLILGLALLYDIYKSTQTKPRPKSTTIPKPPTPSLDIYRYTKRKYLKSPEWQSRRKLSLQAASYSCEMCGTTGTTLHIHHISYANLYNEPLSDLACVCEDCHDRIHSFHGFPQSVEEYSTFHAPLLPFKRG